MNEKVSGPAFSVIIAVYNGDATLSRAIDSAMMQSYLPHEVIVVDDGSTDGTAKIAKGYGDRVRYLRQHNAGVAAARNAGVQAATGDWLAFLDADDWYYPDRLRLHAEWICEDGALDFLTGDYDYMADNGRFLSRSMETHEAGRLMLDKANGAPRVVMSLEDFEPFVCAHFPPAIRRGVVKRLSSARLNLGYALVRNGRRAAALRAVAPTLVERPSIKAFRDLLSMLM